MKKLIPIFLIYIFFTSCGGGGGSSDVLPPPGNTGNTTTNDGFDRTTILTSTYDNIIIPAYNDFNNKLTYLMNLIFHIVLKVGYLIIYIQVKLLL